MTVPEFCSGFGGSANAFLTALKKTGKVGKAKRRDGSRRAEQERGRALGERRRQRRQGQGTCSDRTGHGGKWKLVHAFDEP